MTETQIVAGVYFRLGAEFDRLERQLAEIESRRRKLRDDIDRVKAKRWPPAEDAQLMDDQGSAETP